MTEPLDIFAAPLNAIHLIEASAGTGKTYAIANLYLRLLVEQGYGAGDILVVTYTRAATEELKERIQNRLLEARRAFQQEAADDSFYRRMLSYYPDRARAIRRLNRAILAFDQAAIFTIHGFCQRVLNDSAFASGLPMTAEMLDDDAELLQEIVEDYWRRRFYDIPARWANYVVSAKLDPAMLRQTIRPHLNKPYLRLAEPVCGDTLEQLEPEFERLFQQVQQQWLLERDTVAGLLLDHRGLKKTRYKPEKIQKWLPLLNAWFEQDEKPDCKCPEPFKYFTISLLQDSINQGHCCPEHPFFEACEQLKTLADRLQRCLDSYLLRLQQELLLYCNQELSRRKRQLQVQAYDDLLLNLRNALDDRRRGEPLANAIRERFKAALIDEFQDTDPTQYAIFQTIYGGGGQPVFLVGDPKQAIYSFRGADIFAYLQARRNAAQTHTLGVNWRSAPGLIGAVNALFGGCSQPFLLEQIPFHEAIPAGQVNSRLVADDGGEAPFRFWFVENRPDDGVDKSKRRKDQRHDKKDIRPVIAQATAGRIARLLTLAQQGEAYIAEDERRRPLTGGDIAVLVRNHYQAQEIREALLAVGVPSVQHSQESVFMTAEVVELERVLQAIATPRQEERVRAALLTDLFGVSGDELYQLTQQEQAWENVLSEFHEYHELWRDQGFMQMFRALLSRRDSYRRLLGFRDGERRLTNILHLTELAQAASLQERLGVTGLLKWLAEQRRNHIAKDETRQLRLESDADLVKIVTIHKSKGLEYPIVFCPFLWDGRFEADAEKNKMISFHDPDEDYQAVLDMGSERQAERRPQAVKEELAEDLRLMYVALTRAKHRCYTIWGALKDNEKSGLAWLLYRPTVKNIDADAVTANRDYVKQLNDHGLLSPLQRLAEQSAETIQIEPLPRETVVPYQPDNGRTPPLAARTFTGHVRASRRFASFTGLRERRELDLPDYDAVAEAPLLDSAERSIFTFPQGARAGRCLHAIFEAIDFTGPDAAVTTTVMEQLRKYGFEEDWTDVVALMVEQTLRTPLDAAGQLKLAKIERRRRLTELEFMYPFEQLDMQPVRRLLHEFGIAIEESPDGQDFHLWRGFMRGFIDLAFEHQDRCYLVDYKSTWLGPTLDDYSPAKVAAAMDAGGYHLQYLIYTVALHRYLRWRRPGYDYDQHFGGVRYLFLRGMRPERGLERGVFATRPAWELVRALDEYLNGKEN